MRTFVSLCLLAAGLSACDTAPDAPDSRTEPAPSGALGDDAAAHGHGADADQAPQRLLTIMQQLGTDMTALTHALMRDDFDGVTAAAGAIAHHAPIAPGDLERIRTVLGADMPAFEELDEAVHAASVRLHDAAESRDADAILRGLHEVQAGCVACHQRFRERLLTTPPR